MPLELLMSVSFRQLLEVIRRKTLIEQNLLACKVLNELVFIVLAPKIIVYFNMCKLFFRKKYINYYCISLAKMDHLQHNAKNTTINAHQHKKHKTDSIALGLH